MKTVALKDIFSENYPDQDEMIWEYISLMDIENDTLYAIETIDINKLATREFLECYKNFAKKEQREIVKHYEIQIKRGIEFEPIIINSTQYDHPMVIDGHHRVIAYHKLGIKDINVISIEDPIED